MMLFESVYKTFWETAMYKPNTSFLLSIEDIEVIENALRFHKKDLSMKRMKVAANSAAPKTGYDAVARLDNSVRKIHELMGNLHNQKVFFRPSNMAYVSG